MPLQTKYIRKVENLQALSNKYQKEIVQLQTQIALKDFKKFWENAQKLKMRMY